MRLGFLLVLGSISVSALASDTALIHKHLKRICKTEKFRNHLNVDQLDKTAFYIDSIFRLYADTVYHQEFQARGRNYRNVICSFGNKAAKRIIIGAHYDVCEDQEGADDNASGVSGLLELARMLKGEKLSYRIDLVAYTLEEPPYFETPLMGSYVHAQSLKAENASVYGMISLEMIGYYRNEKKSQDFPFNALKFIYGSKGNFITLVRKPFDRSFPRKFSRKFKRQAAIKSKRFIGPPETGTDLSDNQSYWHFGYSALMITDTSFFRNKNYHKSSDTLETLDINKISQVIDGVLSALLAMQR